MKQIVGLCRSSANPKSQWGFAAQNIKQWKCNDKECCVIFLCHQWELTPYKQLLQYETVHNNEVCVLSGCPYSEVFQQVRSSQKKTKESNNRVLLGALLFGCIVSFVVCNLCLDNYRRNCKTGFDCLTEVKNQKLSQVHPWQSTLSMLFSYLQEVRFQRSAIHMCKTPKWQHCAVFLW